jgi:hypothetical protein
MGSRPVAGRPRPRFLGLANFIFGLACSNVAIGTPTGADGQSGAPFILMPSGAPLAYIICFAAHIESWVGGDGLRSFTTNKNHAPAEEAELRLVEEPVAIAAAPETCPPQAVPELV